MKKPKYRELVELKGLLRKNKLTYENLAKQMKLSISALSDKINGKSVFDLLEVRKIADILCIQMNDISQYFF